MGLDGDRIDIKIEKYNVLVERLRTMIAKEDVNDYSFIEGKSNVSEK